MLLPGFYASHAKVSELEIVFQLFTFQAVIMAVKIKNNPSNTITIYTSAEDQKSLWTYNS